MKQMITRGLRLLAILALFALLSGKAQAAEGKYRRTVENYVTPEVTLVNQNGERVALREYLQSDDPVVVDFIFGTCTAICPILSAGYADFQQKLAPGAKKAKLVSISIDPENDTPKVMKEYLKRYGARPGWDYLTGSRSDIDKVLQAFNAYIPNKMSNVPLTLIRAPSDGSWVRIFGLLSSAEFNDEYSKAGSK